MSKLCRRMHSVRTAALLFLAFVQTLAHGSDELWDLLRSGGQVVVIRHPLTDPGVGDPKGFRERDRHLHGR